jgi:16S rRNA (guanine527-N7)-methyltransferase
MSGVSGFSGKGDSILEAGLRQIAETDPDAAALINCRRQAILELLERYVAEIELFTPAYGLVKVHDRRELVLRHILDSLAPLGIIARLLRPPERGAAPAATGDASAAGSTPASGAVPRAADAGSGAGLPGIPLAVALPRVNFTLIERMKRRAGFLRNTLAVLGLPNAAVEEAEMEKIAPGQFDLVVFRAFRPLEAPVLKNLFRLCAGGGGLAAYKGKRDKIEEEIAAADCAVNCRIFSCPVPFLEEERHIVSMEAGGVKAPYKNRVPGY